MVSPDNVLVFSRATQFTEIQNYNTLCSVQYLYYIYSNKWWHTSLCTDSGCHKPVLSYPSAVRYGERHLRLNAPPTRMVSPPDFNFWNFYSLRLKVSLTILSRHVHDARLPVLFASFWASFLKWKVLFKSTIGGTFVSFCVLLERSFQLEFQIYGVVMLQYMKKQTKWDWP